ncbi:MAG TPA: HAMP domain-containing sensor histidine kinase [Thermomicrobiales bacterium]
MTGSLPGRTLPLRRWLAIALVTIVILPILATGTVVFHLAGHSPDVDDIDRAVALLRRDVDRWSDPAWQAQTTTTLASEGLDFILVEGDREIYRSVADPLAAGDASKRVERVTIADSDPPRTAYIVGDEIIGPPEAVRTWLVPAVGLSTLILTLVGIAWFLGRTVVMPLAATSAAALQVASGNLDVELPSSRVREVADVNAAFEAMSGALRTSLQQQATLEQERRLFVGAVAHDLRTPLFALRGYLEGLQRGIADTPEKRAHYLAVAQEKADALERLIADLFAYTRMEYLNQTPSREPIDLGALMNRLVEGLRPQADTKGVQIEIDTSAGGCTVEGDAHLLTRAVENLLDNALRFTPSGGRVEVACRPSAEGVRFAVADTGPGIPEQDLPHIFSPLFRGETSRNRRTGGAGLGLTTARRILRAHGGDLIARNRVEGGAIFIGTLPRSQTKSLPAAQGGHD